MLGRVEEKMALKKVSILLTLFIFGIIVRAWCDPVKSTNGAAIQLTTMKMDENKAVVQKKTESAKESTEWLKKFQAKLRDVNFLRSLEEKKGWQWVEPLGEAIYSRESIENAWRNKFSGPLQLRRTKSSSAELGQSILKPYPDENGYFEQGKNLTLLRHLHSREEIFKEIFMGFRFSLDLTSGHVLLEMNVTPSSEKRSGLLIRF
jgi:hypothetical protein